MVLVTPVTTDAPSPRTWLLRPLRSDTPLRCRPIAPRASTIEHVSEQDGEATVAFEHEGRAWEIPAKLVEARKIFAAAIAECETLSRATDPESLAKYKQAWDRAVDRISRWLAPSDARSLLLDGWQGSPAVPDGGTGSRFLRRATGPRCSTS